MNDIVLLAKGYIFAEASPIVLDIDSSKVDSNYLNADDIYQLLSSTGYGYA